MPNLFAYIALIIWPLISIVMFKKMQIIPATFWTIVGGYLLLPAKVAIDFPLIPPFNKESISAIAALVGCKYIKKKKIALLPKAGVERWLIIALLITPFITVLNNQQLVFDGKELLQGLTLHDAMSASLSQYLLLIPFLLGLQLVKSYEEQLNIVKLLVVACLWYSLPMLFEVRMSPLLHTWIYGFFPHESFGQQFRYGGFRPVVFMGHGLLVAMFVAISLGLATFLWRERIKQHFFSALTIVVYIFFLLILCKSVGAFLLGAFLFVAISWFPNFILKRIALFIALIFIFYPILSLFELFPHQLILDLAADFYVDRADSLAFRFQHENLLLEHAQTKLFFGWGGWGRSRLSTSITDGYWIIILGQYGIIGFSAFFGLAILAIMRGTKSSQLLHKQQQRLLLSHALIVSVIIVDQLPNHSLYSWSWFLIGALLGRANSVIKDQKKVNKHEYQHRVKIKKIT